MNNPEPMKRSSSNCCFNCTFWTSCAFLSAKYTYVSPNNKGHCDDLDVYSMGFEVCERHQRRSDMPEGGLK